MNDWKNVWEKREAGFNSCDPSDEKSFFLELKRINGFDIVSDEENGISYEGFLQQYRETKNELSFPFLTGDGTALSEVFEVGCGCGANLYLFSRDGIRVGGMDYSEKLIGIAEKIFPDKALRECICGEAVNLPIDITYDAVLSNSVFSYFESEEYALEVLEKMVRKARRTIGILDIHDRNKEQAFIAYRKSIIEDYEERYANLPKRFYDKSFFLKFAEKNHLDIKFTISDIKGYWNNDFIFNCFFYKRPDAW